MSLQNTVNAQSSLTTSSLKITPLNTFVGKFLNFLGKAVKVQSDNGNIIYVKPETITDQLLSHRQLTGDTIKLVTKRIIEIADPNTTQPLSFHKLEQIFQKFRADEQILPLSSDKQVIAEMEKIKLQLSEIPSIIFENSLSEIVDHLQPGDFLIRKYHEKHDNLICTLQKFFHRNGYREAYKCSHLAIYLGEINGKPWIAEASMPHENEVEVRRIELDDPRFSPREMNQYLIIRNRNLDEGITTANLARDFTIKMFPETEGIASSIDVDGSYKYSFFEAARSLWHLPNLGPYGRHRVFKYYSDHKNNIPFEYLGRERKFFCSHFALAMESLAELENSKQFNDFIATHPVPKLYNENKSGLALKVSKLWYSIRKGLWAREMAIFHKKAIMEGMHTHLDPLRSSPQDVVIYMMQHDDEYQVIGQVIKSKDYPNFEG